MKIYSKKTTNNDIRILLFSDLWEKLEIIKITLVPNLVVVKALAGQTSAAFFYFLTGPPPPENRQQKFVLQISLQLPWTLLPAGGEAGGLCWGQTSTFAWGWVGFLAAGLLLWCVCLLLSTWLGWIQRDWFEECCYCLGLHRLHPKQLWWWP